MEHILVYGKEHTFLDSDTGLLFRNSSIQQTAKLHTHTFYEIFIVTDGTALHMINHAIQTLHKGDLIFIRPKDTHTYEFHCSEDFRIINIGFSKRIYQSIVSFLDNYDEFQNLTQSDLPVTVCLKDIELKKVCDEFLTIDSYMKTPFTTHTIFYAKNCLSSIMINYFFHYTAGKKIQQSPPHWFITMIKEMQKIENLQLGYPKMRELSPCSINHLCRLCKKYLSATPTQYINERRLEYSIYLLTQTSEDIITICSLCGFNNLSHFYHLFKETYHTSPACFRKGL